MLVLSRKKNESILLGRDIRVTVVHITGGQVQIGIEAPNHVRIVREQFEDRSTRARTRGYN